MIDLAGLNGLDSVEDGLSDVAQPRRSYGYGDIGPFVADAVWTTMRDISPGSGNGQRASNTYLLTALTMAAVPLPNTSLSLPCFWYSTN